MKIFENNYDIEVGRIIYTCNSFKLLKTIVSENKDILIITPFTKIKEVVNLTKSGGLEHFFTSEGFGIEDILRIDNSSEMVAKVNKIVGNDFAQISLDFQKLIKTIVEFDDSFIDEANINSVLEFVSKHVMKMPQVIVVGFESIEIAHTIPHIEIINNLVGKVEYQNLEGLLIDQSDSLFEVHDVETFVSWLELKTGTALNEGMINNFLNGKADISSYLINNALKNLK